MAPEVVTGARTTANARPVRDERAELEREEARLRAERASREPEPPEAPETDEERAERELKERIAHLRRLAAERGLILLERLGFWAIRIAPERASTQGRGGAAALAEDLTLEQVADYLDNTLPPTMKEAMLARETLALTGHGDLDAGYAPAPERPKPNMQPTTLSPAAEKKRAADLKARYGIEMPGELRQVNTGSFGRETADWQRPISARQAGSGECPAERD